MSVLLDLAARCEAATGPDRELDRRIHVLIILDQEWNDQTRADCMYADQWKDTATSIVRYTASLDAAMTLVDGVLLTLSEIGADGLPLAHVGNPTNGSDGVGIARTLALALCAAALRARAAA